MRIRLSHLRKIIRETIEEQGWPPGRWYPGSGEPVEDEDIEVMGSAGMGLPPDDELEEAKKKRGLWANIHARRRAGKRPKRPGEKGYPKTLDID